MKKKISQIDKCSNIFCSESHPLKFYVYEHIKYFLAKFPSGRKLYTIKFWMCRHLNYELTFKHNNIIEKLITILTVVVVNQM